MLHRPQASGATAISEVHSAGNAALSCGQSRPSENQGDDDVLSYGAVSPVSLSGAFCAVSWTQRGRARSKHTFKLHWQLLLDSFNAMTYNFTSRCLVEAEGPT